MVLGVGVLAKLLKHDTKCAKGRGTATLLEGGHSHKRAAVRQHSYRHRGQGWLERVHYVYFITKKPYSDYL